MTELEQLKTVLRNHDAEFCTCGHEIGFGDIAWNEGCAEYGTPISWVQIQCLFCQKEIAWIYSWTLFNDYGTDEERMSIVLGILKEDWINKNA